MSQLLEQNANRQKSDIGELCNVIAEAARIDYTKYGEGEGPASEWRDW